jgi:hypothetical protein
MTEIDDVFRDLEAGLFLQTQMQRAPASGGRADSEWLAGRLIINFEGRHIEPAQALIGRDFVAWADAQALHIVPGRHASIRVEKSLNSGAKSAASFAMQQKLRLSKYLRELSGALVQVEINLEPLHFEGLLLDVKGSFAIIDSVNSTNLIELSRLTRIRLPVNNFSENVNQGFK